MNEMIIGGKFAILPNVEDVSNKTLGQFDYNVVRRSDGVIVGEIFYERMDHEFFFKPNGDALCENFSGSDLKDVCGLVEGLNESLE